MLQVKTTYYHLHDISITMEIRSSTFVTLGGTSGEGVISLMINRVGIIITLLLLLGSCIPQEKNVNVLHASDDQYEVYLYMKDGEMTDAGSYLNALLIWKTDLNKPQVFTFKEFRTRTDQIGVSYEQLPAIVIKREGAIVGEIYGKVEDDEILALLKNEIPS